MVLDNGYKGTAEVCGANDERANKLGVCDLAGNVWEMTNKVVEGKIGKSIAMIGGAWDYSSWFATTSSIISDDPENSTLSVGFRCAWSEESKNNSIKRKEDSLKSPSTGSQLNQKNHENNIIKPPATEDELLDQLVFFPYKNGNLIGWIIQIVNPESVFYQLGLRGGDILTKINGKEVSVIDWRQDMTKLKSADSLEVIRHGKALELKKK